MRNFWMRGCWAFLQADQPTSLAQIIERPFVHKKIRMGVVFWGYWRGMDVAAEAGRVGPYITASGQWRAEATSGLVVYQPTEELGTYWWKDFQNKLTWSAILLSYLVSYAGLLQSTIALGEYFYNLEIRPGCSKLKRMSA
jgi:hypothetical protein